MKTMNPVKSRRMLEMQKPGFTQLTVTGVFWRRLERERVKKTLSTVFDVVCQYVWLGWVGVDGQPTLCIEVS